MWVGQIIFFIHCSLSFEQFNTHFFPSCHNCPIIPIKQKQKNKKQNFPILPKSKRLSYVTSFHHIEIKLACCWTLNPFIMAFTLDYSVIPPCPFVSSLSGPQARIYFKSASLVSYHIMIILLIFHYDLNTNSFLLFCKGEKNSCFDQYKRQTYDV